MRADIGEGKEDICMTLILLLLMVSRDEDDVCVKISFVGNTQNKTTLGVSFLGQYYTLFDAANKTVSFAQPSDRICTRWSSSYFCF